MEKLESPLELPDGGYAELPEGTQTWVHEGPHGSRLQYTEYTEPECGAKSQFLQFDILPGCADEGEDPDSGETTMSFPGCTIVIQTKNDSIRRITVRTHRAPPST